MGTHLALYGALIAAGVGLGVLLVIHIGVALDSRRGLPARPPNAASQVGRRVVRLHIARPRGPAPATPDTRRALDRGPVTYALPGSTSWALGDHEDRPARVVRLTPVPDEEVRRD